MLIVNTPTILPHQLSWKTIDILKRRIAYSLAQVYSGRPWWLIWDKTLSLDIQDYIDTKIRPLWYQLYRWKNNEWKQNAILAYCNVDLHSDKSLWYEHSTVFIPFDIPGETRFLNYGPDWQLKDLEIKLWDIVIFDQNKLHQIRFLEDKAHDIKYGMALFLDKIPKKSLPHPLSA
jgi:hypothetical protein